MKRFIAQIQPVRLLQWICFCIFAGRAYQHIVWDAPFRTLLWDELLLKDIIEFLTSISWHEYVTSARTDASIQMLIKLNGLFYAICAITSLYLHKLKKVWGYVILAGAFSLSFLAFLYTKEKFFHVGQFFEFSAQIFSPVLLYLMLYTDLEKQKLMLYAKAAIALTFLCHGLYAVGYYPRPGAFVDMTINTLGVGESWAHTFLLTVGILDFIVAIAIFLPTVSVASMYYMFIWGTLTTLARLTSNIYYEFFWESINQWIFEFVVRVPHALLPVVILVLRKQLVGGKISLQWK